MVEEKRSTICFAAMVKNEAHIIERCISSARHLIDAWCVLDTGSTDGTQDLVKSKLSDLPGTLHETEWTDDFGHHRTQLFELARKHADYVLMLDADDLLLVSENFMFGELAAKGYEVRISMGATTWNRLALLRSDKPWSYHSPIHEYAKCEADGPLPLLSGIHIFSMPDGRRRLDEPIAKYERDVETLKGELEQDPENPRNWFYLAQSYRDAGRAEEAIESYRKRASLQGWPEEVWFSLYQIGVLYDKLDKPREALEAYMEAYEARPRRAEPLCAASELACRHKRYGLAWMFGLAASRLDPPNDCLFIDENVYRWKSLDWYAVACYWVGRFRDAQVANRVLLTVAPPPELGRIQKNLELCDERLAPVRKHVGRSSNRGGKKILITGAGRSGTGYVAKVLTESGLLCGHEVVFGPYTSKVEWGEYDGDSSWLAVPWLSTLDNEVLVVHLVRDFLSCAKSWAGVGQFDDDADAAHGPYCDAVYRFAPGVMRLENPLSRIASYWTIWNETVVCHSNITLRIEDVSDGSLSDVFEAAKVDVEPGRLQTALETVPKTVNQRVRDEAVTLRALESATPPAIWKRLIAISERLKVPLG